MLAVNIARHLADTGDRRLCDFDTLHLYSADGLCGLLGYLLRGPIGYVLFAFVLCVAAVNAKTKGEPRRYGD